MGAIRRISITTLTLGCITVSGVSSSAQASSEAARLPQVKVKDVGDVWQYGEAIVAVSTRCFDGAIVQELTVDVDQGGLSSNGDGTEGVVCDGVQRVVPVVVDTTSGDDFLSGSATMTARLTVLDPETGDPLPQGVSTGKVYLRPPAVVAVANGPVRLNANGNAVVRASIKCQPGWLVPGLGVTVSQNGGRIVGGSDVKGVPCDGSFHEYAFTVIPRKPFVAGGVKVSASARVFDPDTYDPVDTALADTNRQALPWGQQPAKPL